MRHGFAQCVESLLGAMKCHRMNGGVEGGPKKRMPSSDRLIQRAWAQGSLDALIAFTGDDRVPQPIGGLHEAAEMAASYKEPLHEAMRIATLLQVILIRGVTNRLAQRA